MKEAPSDIHPRSGMMALSHLHVVDVEWRREAQLVECINFITPISNCIPAVSRVPLAASKYEVSSQGKIHVLCLSQALGTITDCVWDSDCAGTRRALWVSLDCIRMGAP